MKRRDLFFIYLFCSVIVVPLALLELVAKNYGLSQFILMSILVSMFLIPFGLIADLFNPVFSKKGFFKEESVENKDLKLLSKKTKDNSTQVPEFMCAISPMMIPLYLLNHKETLYYFNFKNGVEKISIQVSKEVYLKYESGDLVNIKVSHGEATVNLSWLEMMVLCKFKDTISDTETRFLLAK